MKYLSDYTNETIDNVIRSNGGFFAFSDEQFNEQKKDNVKYQHLYGNLYAPIKNIKAISTGIENAHKLGVEMDLKENGIKKIIHRELANYEVQLGMDGIIHARNSLKDYGVTEEQLQKEYNAYMEWCIKTDNF